MKPLTLSDSPPARLLLGASYPFRGAGIVLGNRRVLALSVLPFLAGLLIYALAVVALIFFADNVADLILAPGAWWRTVLRVLMIVTMWAVFLVALVFTYAIVVIAVAAPFFEFLSAAAERAWTGEVVEEATGWKEILVDLWRGLAEAVKFLSIEVVLPVFALIVPPVSTVICLGLSAILLGLEQMEGPMGRRRMKFRHKVAFARKNFWQMLGFGGVMLLALLIPFAGVAFLPMGVAGATAMFCDMTSDGDR